MSYPSLKSQPSKVLSIQQVPKMYLSDTWETEAGSSIHSNLGWSKCCPPNRQTDKQTQ